MNEKIIIEVGVREGGTAKRHYSKFKLPVYGFEPNPKMLRLAKKMFVDVPDVHIFDYAIDIESGVKNFYISGKEHYYGCSSLHQFTDNIHELWANRPDFIVTETIKTKTIRLDEFLVQNNLTESIIQYLHCDAQGNDLNVLMSLGEYIKNVRTGQIEVAANVELYKNTNNTFENACRFLLKAGFKIGTRRNLQFEEEDITFWR